MGKKVVSLIIILIVILAAAGIYFTWFYNYNCNDLACFQAHQKDCTRTEFVNDVSEATWKYEILGEENGKCQIDVTMLQAKQGNIDMVRIQGKTMTCGVDLGSTVSPESDLENCHGILKEEFQSVIIKNLHAYIVENVGEVKEGLDSAF